MTSAATRATPAGAGGANAESKETSALGLALTLVGLLALAALSLALRYAHLGAFGLPVALLIAVAKAALVAVFFMEILLERVTVRLAMGTGLMLLGILLALIAADVFTRETPPLTDPPGTEARDHG